MSLGMITIGGTFLRQLTRRLHALWRARLLPAIVVTASYTRLPNGELSSPAAIAPYVESTKYRFDLQRM